MKKFNILLCTIMTAAILAGCMGTDNASGNDESGNEDIGRLRLSAARAV